MNEPSSDINLSSFVESVINDISTEELRSDSESYNQNELASTKKSLECDDLLVVLEDSNSVEIIEKDEKPNSNEVWQKLTK